MSRVKTVYPTEEVTHLWANRAVSHDIRNKLGNLLTIHDGNTLLSYGRHFVIGTFITGKKGERLLLWNNVSTTPTTNNHRSIAWRALPSGITSNCLRTDGLTASELERRDFGTMAERLATKALNELEQSRTQRSRRESTIRRAHSLVRDAERLLRFTGMAKLVRKLPKIKREMSKEEVDKLLRVKHRKQYNTTAAEHLGHAARYLRVATNTNDYGSNRNAALEAAISQLSHHAAYTKRAGRKPGAEYHKLLQQVETLRPEVRAAALEQHRKQRAYDLTGALKDYYSYMRLRRWDRSRSVNTQSVISYSQWPRVWQAFTHKYLNKNDVLLDRIADADLIAMDRRVQTCLSVDVLKRHVSTAATSGTTEHELRRYLGEVSLDLHNNRKAVTYWTDRTRVAVKLAQEAAAEEEKRALIQRAELVTRWRAGDGDHLPWGLPTLLRIQQERGELVVRTSRQASVPASHAQRLLRIARKVAAAGGKHWNHDEGPLVGHFRVTHIGPDMQLVIGCHQISSEEAHHIAALLDQLPQQEEQSPNQHQEV